MSVLTWDDTGAREFELGVDHGVLYKPVNGVYSTGVAWNGLISVSQSPDGAEPNDLWADNIKYGSIYSAETFGGTIEAYMSPPEFDECDGTASLATGVSIGQQTRKAFGLSYRTKIGNDTDGVDHGYKLHLVYGAMASPSERSYETMNDSPDAMTLSWDFETTPVAVTGFKPTSHIEIDSTLADSTKLEALEAILYGSASNEPRLPLPDEIKTLMT